MPPRLLGSVPEPPRSPCTRRERFSEVPCPCSFPETALIDRSPMEYDRPATTTPLYSTSWDMPPFAGTTRRDLDIASHRLEGGARGEPVSIHVGLGRLAMVAIGET